MCDAGCAEIFKPDRSAQSSLPGNLAAGRRPSFAVHTIAAPLVDGTTLAGWLDSIFGEGQGDAEQRATLTKSALALLIFAHGTPCIAAADVESLPVRQFVAEALHARAQAAHLLQPSAYDGARSVAWCDQHGNAPAWDHAHARDAVLIEVAKAGGALGCAACVAVNSSWEMVQIALPPTQGTALWQPLVDSGGNMSVPGQRTRGALLRAGSTYWLAPKAVALFLAEPQPQAAAPSHGLGSDSEGGGASQPSVQADGTYW